MSNDTQNKIDKKIYDRNSKLKLITHAQFTKFIESHFTKILGFVGILLVSIIIYGIYLYLKLTSVQDQLEHFKTFIIYLFGLFTSFITKFLFRKN